MRAPTIRRIFIDNKIRFLLSINKNLTERDIGVILGVKGIVREYFYYTALVNSIKKYKPLNPKFNIPLSRNRFTKKNKKIRKPCYIYKDEKNDATNRLKKKLCYILTRENQMKPYKDIELKQMPTLHHTNIIYLRNITNIPCTRQRKRIYFLRGRMIWKSNKKHVICKKKIKLF